MIALKAIFFFECLAMYGVSAAMLGSLGQIVNTLIMMCVIILGSNLWGLLFGEWKNCSKNSKNTMIFAICLFLIAIYFQMMASCFR